jgi:hypothetical protein
LGFFGSKNKPSGNPELKPQAAVLRFTSTANCPRQGCQIFLTQFTKTGGKYSKLPLNYHNGHKMYQIAVVHQPFPFQGPLKFGTFGLKIYHLANCPLRLFFSILSIEILRVR